MAQSVDISIIVPAFNEADNVLPLVAEVTAAFAKVAATYELVLVDDCSRDATWEKIQEAHRRDPRVRGLRLTRNSGQSAALWTGILATTSPVIATLDADLQNDPADLPRLLVELKDVDFVCGARAKRQDNFVRRCSSRIARAARKAVLGADFADTGCALRVFKRETMAGLFGFNGLHRFLPILVHGGGFTTKEVPVNHRPRVAGVSKYGVWNRVWRGLVDLFGVAWFQKRRVKPVSFTKFP
ncbi:MAG: glycosyltransferase family 2 protein [Verrucomicrobia bacterium]|nr:glycosyltransferase family 2 protein [Verrucomicrobiota bacterium]